MPGAGDDDELRVLADLRRDAPAVRRGRQPVVGRGHDGHRHPPQHLERRRLVVVEERGVERHRHRPRRLLQQFLHQADVGQVGVVRAEQQPPGHPAAEPGAAPPEPLQQRRDQLQEPQVERQQPQLPDQLDEQAQDAGLHEPAGRGGQQEDADDAVAEQLRPLPGQGEDAHPAHRVPGQHHRAGRGDGVEDLAEVAPGAVDRRGGQLRPARPAVAALVPEHQPRPVPQRRPLQLPLGQPGGEPVREDDGDAGRPPTPSTSTCSGTPSSVVTTREPGGGGPLRAGRGNGGWSIGTRPSQGDAASHATAQGPLWP